MSAHVSISRPATALRLPASPVLARLVEALDAARARARDRADLRLRLRTDARLRRDIGLCGADLVRLATED